MKEYTFACDPKDGLGLAFSFTFSPSNCDLIWQCPGPGTAQKKIQIAQKITKKHIKEVL